MTQYLPPNLLALFSARPPIPYKPPVDQKKKNSQNYVGLTDFLSNFETTAPPPATRGETREEKDKRKRAEILETAKQQLDLKITDWDPHNDANATGDPFKTLFVGRINYDTTESKLRRELESYGHIKNIKLVFNVRTRKPRGYAFVEFENEKDMHSAYKHSDGKKVDGRRIVVDVERGRTVKTWKPRKLGGGLGGTRRGGPDDNIRHSGRVEQWERDRGSGRDRDKGDRRRSRSPRAAGGRADRDRDRSRRDRSGDRRDRDRDRSRRDDRPRENGDAGDVKIKIKEEPGLIKEEPLDAPGDDGEVAADGIKKEEDGRPKEEKREERSSRSERDRSRRDRDKERSSRSDRDRDRDRSRRDRSRDRDRDSRKDRDRDSRRDRDRDDKPPPPPDVVKKEEPVDMPVHGEEMNPALDPSLMGGMHMPPGDMVPPPPPDMPPPPPPTEQPPQQNYTVSYSNGQ